MNLHLNTLLIFGIALILGIVVARFMDELSTPHVVGFILLGVLLGDSFLHLIPLSKAEELSPIADLALGFIGFGMGEHLLISDLRKLGKSIIAISLLESFGAYVFVFAGVYLFSKSLPLSMMLASLASATAPAATVDVLRQYQSEGPLTTTLLAVVGIDDAIALLLFSITTPIALTYAGGTSIPILDEITIPLIHIFGSIILGVACAFPVDFFVARMDNHEEILLLMISSVLVVVGISIWLNVSVILSALIFGTATINLEHTHAEHVSNTIDRVSPILYILFFVVVGARLDVRLVTEVGLVAIAYLVFRAFGKISGAYLGARLSDSGVTVQKYLGMTLLSQAGVAVGLALSIASEVSNVGAQGAILEQTIITTVIATTLVVQLVGPILTKMAIFRAGEVTDEHGTFFG
ncbi:MAG: cation:proton antiporter [Anaerolineales bacterium]|jgi:Kef-type K+ transport system membrane component KefB